MPKGKKRESSLREKEKQIEADLFDRIVTNGGNYTVLELVEKYISLKTGVRHNTVEMCIRDRLETAGLIMRVRQGVGEPNRIYVLIPGKEDAALA